MSRTTEVVHFSGEVQGVGFRASTQRLARGCGVDGYVQNMVDGRVEMVVTGEPAAIARLMDRIRGLYERGISGIERHGRPEVEEFSGFSIRRGSPS